MKSNPHQRLRDAIIENTGDKSNVFIENIPKKWEKFSDVVLFNEGTFGGEVWKPFIGNDFWNGIAEALDVKRIGIKGEIRGRRRESNVMMVLGDNDWVIRLENGIKFGYNFTKCMFSAGNINERRRMGEIVTNNEIVVDLYAGIGYYSLPILANGLAKHVYCFDWNPTAIYALKRNIGINGIDGSRCSVIEGDNRITTNEYRNIADRVILGLLPSSFGGFEAALRVLKGNGGILHIHGLGKSGSHLDWITEVEHELLDYNYKINKKELIVIKSHSPHWNHLVLDLQLEGK